MGSCQGCSEAPQHAGRARGAPPNPFHPHFCEAGGSPVIPGEPAIAEFGGGGEVLSCSTAAPRFVPSLGVFRARNECRAQISVASSSIMLRGDVQGTAAIQDSHQMTKKSGKREIFVPFFFFQERKC